MPVHIGTLKGCAEIYRTEMLENERSSTNKRKSVPAKLYFEVAARQGSFYYWCGITIVREARISPVNR